MAKTANLYARIEPDVKAQAEDILAALGIPVSNAINMFYKQIILQRGIPFELKLPSPNVPDMSKMTQEAKRNCTGNPWIRRTFSPLFPYDREIYGCWVYRCGR